MSATDLAVYVAAFLVGTLAVGRVTRLVVFDSWPPVAFIRRKWDAFTNTSDWNLLLHCQYCLAPYFAAADVGWAYLADLHWSWWFVNLIFAASYTAAMVVTWDGDDG